MDEQEGRGGQQPFPQRAWTSPPPPSSSNATRKRDGLKLWSLMLRFQRFTRRSSALMYVSPSELMLIELIW